MTPGKKLVLLVERVSGIVLPERELRRITSLADERAAELGFRSTNAYVEALRSSREWSEWRFLLNKITVKESSLFRAPKQFACLADHIVPELLNRGRQKLKIWSAGCARGEEPATLGLVLDQALGPHGLKWTVIGTDVDEAALEHARQGTFHERSLRRVPARILERYFKKSGKSYHLSEKIRSNLEFSVVNLIHDPLEVPGSPFDIVFLRNVLIYFRRESQQRVIDNVAKLMATDGVLMVGPSESLRGLSSRFVAEPVGGVFVYRRKDTSEEVSAVDPVRVPSVRSERSTDVPNKPREVATYVAEGRIAEINGDNRSALRCYRAALYLRPNLVQVRLHFACCLIEAGWRSRAQNELKTALAMVAGQSGEMITIPGEHALIGPGRIADECLRMLKTVEDSRQTLTSRQRPDGACR